MSYCSECSAMRDSDVCGECGEPTDEVCVVCNEVLDNCDCDLWTLIAEWSEIPEDPRLAVLRKG
jgi:hypothetical protein